MCHDAYTQPIDNRTTVTILAPCTDWALQDLEIILYDVTDPAKTFWYGIDERQPPIDPVTYDVTLTFPIPETCMLQLRKRNH